MTIAVNLIENSLCCWESRAAAWKARLQWLNDESVDRFWLAQMSRDGVVLRLWEVDLDSDFYLFIV